VDRAFQEAGLRKPEHVGTVHVLRHSGAIARLEATGNPKAVQDQLRHKEARMTLRYLKTLSAQESLRIQQGVDFRW
jgi:integrase